MREHIRDPSSLTPIRLTQILSECGVLTSGSVTIVEQLQTIEASSACFIFIRLTYASSAITDAPTALFLKTYTPPIRKAC